MIIRGLYTVLLLFLISCKDKSKVVLSSTDVYKSKGVEIPIYNFKDFEPLLSIDDEKIRIINFWATWCKPCVSELPYFELINSKYSNKGVEVILVSLDLADQIESKLIPFVKKLRMESKIVLLDDTDANNWIPKVNENWSGSIPATIIYKGNTSFFYEKSLTYNELEKELKKFFE